jgi:hypothetical protein
MNGLRECLMRKTTRSLATWVWVAGAVTLLALAVLLTGCSGPAVIAAVEPTATVFAPPPTDIPAPPPGPTPAALEFPLPAPTHEEADPVSDQSCVDCHTDEEMLKAVAAEERGEHEALSEGEG